MKNQKRNIILTVLGLLAAAVVLAGVLFFPAIERNGFQRGDQESYNYMDDEFETSYALGLIGIAILAGVVVGLNRGSLLLPLGIAGFAYNTWVVRQMRDALLEGTPRGRYWTDGETALLVVIGGMFLMILLGIVNLILWWFGRRATVQETVTAT